MYLAAKSLLSSSKLPIKMAGVTLAAALYAVEGDGAKEALGMEDMEFRIKAQVGGEMLCYTKDVVMSFH